MYFVKPHDRPCVDISVSDVFCETSSFRPVAWLDPPAGRNELRPYSLPFLLIALL